LHVLPVHPCSTRRGFTLVEVLVVAVILTLALGEVTRSMLTISRLEPITRLSDTALQAAATQIDTMRASDFDTLVARFNEDDADDPDGPGTAPGPSFAVAGLQVRSGDPDGMAGRVELPLIADKLREDVDDVELGMPRDLDFDGAIDALDHSADYAILPVRIVIEWTAEGHDHRVELNSALASPD